MTREQENIIILDYFQESMEPFRNQRIALYGLGINSEYIVLHQTGYQIVGLMDAAREGETCWGLPVITKEQAAHDADVIVIVARKKLVPIIYERIADLKEQGIRIVNILGEQVTPCLPESEIEEQEYFTKSCKDLEKSIEEHDVIVCNIYDTLIMRQVLSPEDISRVAGKIRKQQPADTQESISLEYDIEKLYAVPREVVAKAIENAWDLGKEVYLITDTYFSTEQMAKILKKCRITHYHEIIRYGEGEELRKRLQTYRSEDKKLLFIGECKDASAAGVNIGGMDYFCIWSARKMLENSYLKTLTAHVRTLEDSIVLGMYLAKAFNDPFMLSRGKGRLWIASKEQLGYISYGMLITSYLHWLLNKYRSERIDKILFLARDGYIPERMYQTLLRERGISNAPRGVYVLASRRCLAGAAICSEQDLIEQAKRISTDAPAGSILELRFDIKPRENDALAGEHLQGEDLIRYLLSYRDEILQESKREKTNYLNYLHSLGIRYEKENNILFDSETIGTSAHYYRKITESKSRLDCIALVGIPDYSLYDDALDTGYLGLDIRYVFKLGYTRCTILNDSVLISNDNQVIKIDDDGNPVFLSGVEDGAYERVCEVWDGMERFLSDYIRNTPYDITEQNVSVELLDDIMRILSSDKCMVDKKIENDFFIEESFSSKSGRISFDFQGGGTLLKRVYE